MYKYPDAGATAPPEVKLGIERFHNTVSEEIKEKIPLLYFLLGSGTNPYKMSYEDSDYTDTSETEGQTCSNCVHLWVSPVLNQTICDLVKDGVQEGGWCRLWQGL